MKINNYHSHIFSTSLCSSVVLCFSTTTQLRTHTYMDFCFQMLFNFIRISYSNGEIAINERKSITNHFREEQTKSNWLPKNNINNIIITIVIIFIIKRRNDDDDDDNTIILFLFLPIDEWKFIKLETINMV